MLKRIQDTNYPLLQYRFARRYGYGNNKLLRPDHALETKSLDDYPTYYDYLKDLHYLSCPIYESLYMQPDPGPFTGQIYNDWLLMIYNNLYCHSYAYTAEAYIMHMAIGVEALETKKFQDYFNLRLNTLCKQFSNKSDIWAVILNEPDHHDDDIEIVLSNIHAAKKINMQYFMQDIINLKTNINFDKLISQEKILWHHMKL